METLNKNHVSISAKSQEPPKQHFTYAGVEYFVQDISDLNKTEMAIACYKIVKNKPEQFLFVTNKNYKVLRFHVYSESRWYDVKNENGSIKIEKL